MIYLAVQLYDLIKSRVECHDFRDRLELAKASLLLQDLPAGKQVHYSLNKLYVRVAFSFNSRLLNFGR